MSKTYLSFSNDVVDIRCTCLWQSNVVEWGRCVSLADILSTSNQDTWQMDQQLFAFVENSKRFFNEKSLSIAGRVRKLQSLQFWWWKKTILAGCT